MTGTDHLDDTVGPSPSTPVPAPVRLTDTLRTPMFARFITGVSIANIGQFLQNLAVPFYVNELTDSNTWVGGTAFAALIPALFATPIAGTLADRIDRRLVLVTAYAAQLVVTSTFLVLFAADLLTPWRIVILQFLSGTAAGFQWAPIQSMAAVLVPRRHLEAAARVVSISFTAGRALGPAAAAVLLAFWGVGPALAATVVVYTIGLAVLSVVRTSWQPTKATEGFLTQFRAGVGHVWHRLAYRSTVLLAFFVGAFGSVFAFSLVATINDDIFGRGGGGLGLLSTALGVGSILASLWIAGPGGRVRRSRVELGAIAAYGLGLVIVAATSVLAVGVAGYVVMGVAHMLHGVTLTTALQVQVDEAYRGRVMAVWLMSLFVALPLGSISAGALADVWPVRWVVLAFVAAMMAGCGLVAVRSGGLAFLDEALDPDEVDPVGSDGGA